MKVLFELELRDKTNEQSIPVGKICSKGQFLSDSDEPTKRLYVIFCFAIKSNFAHWDVDKIKRKKCYSMRAQCSFA